MPTRRRTSPPTETTGLKPFLKWVGGKRHLIAQLQRYLPERFGRYHEPFLGGGALFFFLSPRLGRRRAYLADSNLRLVRAYLGLRSDPDGVIRLLRSYPHERRFFLEMRAWPVDQRSDAEVAAWLIYLNKTAYNGLYRVNSRNLFNVPFGDYARPTICDEPRLRACAACLQGARVEQLDFEQAAERAEPNDLVYFDPPYVPLSTTSSFTSYTSQGFGPEDQVRLRDLARRLKQRGVHVLVSNSSAQAVRELYRDGFQLARISARRAIAARVTERGPIGELLIR
jgi:DNA adenine methylase